MGGVFGKDRLSPAGEGAPAGAFAVAERHCSGGDVHGVFDLGAGGSAALCAHGAVASGWGFARAAGDEAFSHGRHDSELVQAFPAGPGGAVLRAAVGVATGAGAETWGRLQSGLGLDGVRALWGTGGSEARVQPAQAWTGFAPSAAGGVGRSQLYSARLAAEREHAFRQRGGGISEGSDGQAGKPGVDSGGPCRLRILCARVIAIPGGI